MKKLQQFYVYKFNSDYLRFKNYNLTCDINEARRNKWLVSLADSQALRTIRRIRYSRNSNIIQFDPIRLDENKKRKKRLLKEKYTEENIKEIKKISNEIDEMLFVPEYVLVVIEKNSQYIKIIREGLFINGHKYVRLLCGAGMARNNTVALIREDFEEELKINLENGWNNQIKITDNKFNAYFALSSTATWQIDDKTHPELIPNVLLIDDCEMKMTKKVDWVENCEYEDIDDELRKLKNKSKISTQNKELNFNFFDGSGAIDISAAKKWAEILELDYIPSVFILRNIYIKGCLFVVDFKKFAKEVAKKDKIKDLYGIEQTIQDKDIILTKSMFKLWNAYESMEQYQNFCNKYDNHWGVSRVSPKNDDDYVTTNYQFLQALNMNQSDVEEICEITKDWLRGVSGLDRNYSMLFLMGNLASKYDTPEKTYNAISDYTLKALAIEPDMINDPYIRQKLITAINKKIKESYLGKLLVRGCFSTMIPDPYAFMEWAFSEGDISKVHGLLKTLKNVQEIDNNGELCIVDEESEHYSRYWNNRNVSKAIGCRSPLTFRSECVKLNFIKNDLTEEWYQYINSGIIYNIWSNDCMLHADSDFDGDIVFTTDNPVFLRCKYYDELNNLPITYEKKTVEKHVINQKNLHKADIKSFNSTIGQVTNYSTSMYDMIYKYTNDYTEKGRKNYNELLERLKLTRKAQGDAIDKAKGVKCDDYPVTWIRKQKIYQEDSDEVKNEKMFLNEICADRKPAFFKYRYAESNEKDKKFKNGIEMYKMLNPDFELTDEIQGSLIDYNSPMNKVFHYMEDNLKCLKKEIKTSDLNIVLLLKTNKEPLQDYDKINYMKSLCDKYFEEKSKFKKGINKEFDNIDQASKEIRLKALDVFENEEEIANYVVEICYIQKYHQSKSFAWNVFGSCLINNLIKNSNHAITVPMRDDSGDIKYLFNNYALKEVELNDSNF